MIHPRVIMKLTEKLIIDNSPTILTAIGVVGSVTSAYLTGKASFHAARILAEEPEDATTKEKVKYVWKSYIPAVGVGTVTVLAIIGANRIGVRRAAGLAAAYSLSERAWAEYKTKVVEHLGEKKEQKIRDEVAQDRVNQQPLSDRAVVFTGGGEVLFFDSLSGRYFRSTMEEVKQAENKVNFLIIHNNYASLTDFYNEIGLAQTIFSEEMGWNLDELMATEFSTTLSDNGEPAIVLNYKSVPIRGYHRLQ